KMVLAGELASVEDRLRFLQEAEIIAQLRHPNVVEVYELGSYQGNPFFSLEFLEGGSLAKRLKGEPQPPRPAAELVQTLARAILYELLTGRPPFKGTTGWDTVQMVLTEEPVAPSRLQSGVPRDLETICLKCLDKQPQRRYASAAELAEDLRRFQANEPIRARP